MLARLLMIRYKLSLRYVLLLAVVVVAAVVVAVVVKSSVNMAPLSLSEGCLAQRGEDGQGHMADQLDTKEPNQHTPRCPEGKVSADWEETTISTKGDSAETEAKSATKHMSSTAEDLSAGTEDDEVTAELKERRSQMNRVCASRKSGKHINGVFVNNDHRLAYCFVPKTGCTFWKQVFGFLDKDTLLKTPIRSPFDIPRFLVHKTRHARGESWVKVKDKIQRHFRFMFSRDPYTRLWSVYLDKFYLVDFWPLYGGAVLKTRTPTPSPHDISCGSNVTFAEFVTFSLTSSDQHWDPVAHVCDPCEFNPDLLGKMDTYSRDARVVLKQAGLEWILEHVDHDQHVRNELELLVQYNFKFLASTPKLGQLRCINKEGLARRLWTVFQYNGYISETIPFPASSTFSVDAFRGSVLEAFNQSVGRQGGREDLRQQKERAMRTAYQSLSRSTLRKIASHYDVDFRMFGYTAMSF